MYFPFLCDISGRKIVIVGGGNVALRKCELFLDFGADVTVVSPNLCEGLSKRLGEISYICDRYKEEYIHDAFAVIAACDDAAVNEAVSSWCMANRVHVNVVDEPANCSFIIPAVLRRGDLTISVSTGGKSPALAAKIRRELLERYGDEYAERLSLLGGLKKNLKRIEPDREKRGHILVAACELDDEKIRELIKTAAKGISPAANDGRF